MDRIWANRLMAGTKTWDEVPSSRRNAVREILAGRVAEKNLSDARYEEITGEKYREQTVSN